MRGDKEKKSNRGQGVIPTPKATCVVGRGRYEVLGESSGAVGGFRTLSPTSTRTKVPGGGGAFGALTEGESERVRGMSIEVRSGEEEREAFDAVDIFGSSRVVAGVPEVKLPVEIEGYVPEAVADVLAGQCVTANKEVTRQWQLRRLLPFVP